jgi:hypothetical protein
VDQLNLALHVAVVVVVLVLRLLVGLPLVLLVVLLLVSLLHHRFDLVLLLLPFFLRGFVGLNGLDIVLPLAQPTCK